MTPSHFLFIAGALRERSSQSSAEVQLNHQVWGIRTALIRENLARYMSGQCHGLVYVLKVGLYAGFEIVPGLHPFTALDEFVRDDLREEARYGFVRVKGLRRWTYSSEQSLALLQRVLHVPDRSELTRRLNLGMHVLTQDQYEAIVQSLESSS